LATIQIEINEFQIYEAENGHWDQLSKGMTFGIEKQKERQQRHNTENLKQIFPEKELRGLSTKFHIHVSVSELYIPMNGLPILLQENMLTDSGNI
jgi:hypothetical protein